MKQMIWSSYDLLDETAKEYYQNSQREILDDDCYEVSDEEWAEEVYRWLDDERSNIRLLYRPRSFVYLPSFLLSITGLVLPDAKVGRRT